LVPAKLMLLAKLAASSAKSPISWSIASPKTPPPIAPEASGASPPPFVKPDVGSGLLFAGSNRLIVLAWAPLPLTLSPKSIPAALFLFGTAPAPCPADPSAGAENGVIRGIMLISSCFLVIYLLYYVHR
jgi:hypothetical protein